MTALPDTLRAFAEDALRLASLLGQADEIQWQPSPTPKPREDTTERSKGGHGDPTASIVADDRRLAVRVAVLKGEGAIEQAAAAVRSASADLEHAIDRWTGAL